VVVVHPHCREGQYAEAANKLLLAPNPTLSPVMFWNRAPTTLRHKIHVFWNMMPHEMVKYNKVLEFAASIFRIYVVKKHDFGTRSVTTHTCEIRGKLF